jgi:hypothetical protein
MSGSSIRPSAFRRSDFSPLAAASCLNPCSTVTRHKRFLTLVSRFRPFACWPPSQPSYAFHPHHGPPILRSHNTRGSQHRFFGRAPHFPTTSSEYLPHHCSPLSMLSVARHTRFPTSVPAFVPCISAARPLSRSFIHASDHLARPKLRQRPDASTSSPDHDLHYQCPTPHP